MKSFATKDKSVSSTVRRKSSVSCFTPAVVQRKQRDNIHQIIQTRLTIGESNDKYEREADDVANRVVANQPVTEISSISGSLTTTNNQPAQASLIQCQEDNKEEEPVQAELIQRQENEKEEEPLQAKLIQCKGDKNEDDLQSVNVAVQAINSNPSGAPIRHDVRRILESGMGADLSNVRVHESQTSHEANASINAKAFTHRNNIWLGAGQSQSDIRLMAHEATHVVQQSGGLKNSAISVSQVAPRVQRWNTFSAAAELAGDAVDWVAESIDEAIDYVKEKAAKFVQRMPGFALFSVIYGSNPITGQTVERNGRNFIDAGLDIIPGGRDLKRKLEEEGALAEAALWLDNEINALEFNPSVIDDRLAAFWNSLSVSDVNRIPALMDRLFNIFNPPVQRIIRFAVNVGERLLEMVKDYLISSLINFIKERTTAYPLLTQILGRDPVSGETVERSAIGLLRGFMLLTESGTEQLRQMEESGSLLKAADWLDGAVGRLRLSWEMLVSGFLNIWNSISIQSLMDPAGVFRQIYDTFAEPLGRIIRFIVEVSTMVLRFIKDALISRLVAYARTIRGYPLLTVLLGRDPFSDAPVERSTENIVHGFMSLMEGGEEQFQEMKQTGAITRLTARVENAIATLNFTWEYIKGLFVTAWNRFSLSDLATPLAAFARLLRIFAAPLTRLIRFVAEIIKIVIEVILNLMNFPIALVSNIITRAMEAFDNIKRDPIGFLKNLLRAVKTGFVKFFDNIATHLINGITGWLFKELRDAGISPPTDFSFQSILGFVMDVLGVSMNIIFQKLAARIGQDRVDRIRGMMDRLTGIWSFVSDVMTRGPIAIWEYIKDQLSNLWNVVLDAVRNWVMTRIITQITARLLSMLDPTGIMAVVNSFIAFYNAIQSFIAYLREMLEVVNSFVEGVAEIAMGSVETAANFLEGALGRSIPIVIGFLANQVGLGGVGRKIGEMIESVRAMVDRALDWLIDRAVGMGTSFLNMVRGGSGDNDTNEQQTPHHTPEQQAQIDRGLESITIEEARYAQNGKISLADAQRVATTIRRNNPVFRSFDVVDGGDSWDYKYSASPEVIVDTAETQKSEGGGQANTPPEYGGLRNGYGTSVYVAYMKSPHPMGSPPSVGNTTDYDAINIRRKGSGSYYVKGHLLNENLGGPGSTWSNLTPLTQKANGDHKRDFENAVKQAVNGKLSGLPGEPSDLGWMVNFRVVANYTRTVDESLVNRLLNTDDDVGLDDNADRAEVAKILRAEQNVPSSLDCSVDLYNKDGTAIAPAGTVPIENDISYGQLNQYQLSASSRTRYVLADNFDFISASSENASEQDIRSRKVAATLALQQLNGIDESKAIAIYNAFARSGRINNYVRDIGISKQELEAANPRLRITGGTKRQ